MYFPPPILPLFWQSLPATFRWYLLMDLLPCMFLFYFMLIFWCIFQFWQLRCIASNNTILKGTDRATTALQFVSVCTSLFFFYFEVTGCPCQTLLHYCGISLDEEDEIKARQVLGCPPRQKSRKPLGCQSKLPVFSQRKERKIRSACFMFQAFPSIWRDENEMILLMTFDGRGSWEKTSRILLCPGHHQVRDLPWSFPLDRSCRPTTNHLKPIDTTGWSNIFTGWIDFKTNIARILGLKSSWNLTREIKYKKDNSKQDPRATVATCVQVRYKILIKDKFHGCFSSIACHEMLNSARPPAKKDTWQRGIKWNVTGLVRCSSNFL